MNFNKTDTQYIHRYPHAPFHIYITLQNVKLFGCRHLFALLHVDMCRKCKVYLSNDIIKPFNKFVSSRVLCVCVFFLFCCRHPPPSSLWSSHHHTKRVRSHHECHLIACNPRCVRPFTLIYFHNAHCLSFSATHTIANQQHTIYFVISTNYLIWFLLVFTVSHTHTHMHSVNTIYWHCLRSLWPTMPMSM